MGAGAILDFGFWISDFGLTLLSAYCLLRERGLGQFWILDFGF
jgi:hypothetical protein